MPHSSSRVQLAFSVIAVGVFVVVCFIMAGMAKASGAPSGFAAVPILMAVVGLAVIAFNAYGVITASRKTGIDVTGTGREFDPLARGPRPHFCAHCGAAIDDDNNFCAHCGMAIE